MNNYITLNFKQMSFPVRCDKIKSLAFCLPQTQLAFLRLTDSCAKLLCNTKWDNDINLGIHTIHKGYHLTISAETTMARFVKFNKYFTAYSNNPEAEIFEKAWTNASIAHIESILKRTKKASVTYEPLGGNKIKLFLHITISQAKLTNRDSIDKELNPSNKIQKLRFILNYSNFEKLFSDEIIYGINLAIANPKDAVKYFSILDSVFSKLLLICTQIQISPIDESIFTTINDTITLSANTPNCEFKYWLQDLSNLECNNHELQLQKKIGYIILSIKDNFIKYICDNSKQPRYVNGEHIKLFSLFILPLVQHETKHQKMLLDILIINIALNQQAIRTNVLEHPTSILYDKYFCYKYTALVRNYLTLLLAINDNESITKALFTKASYKHLIKQQPGVYQAYILLKENPKLLNDNYGETAIIQEVITWRRKLPASPSVF